MECLDCLDRAVSWPAADTKAVHLLFFSHKKKHFFVQLLDQPADIDVCQTTLLILMF